MPAKPEVTGLQCLYLSLSVIGLVATWYFNLQFIAESGGTLDVVGFFRAGYTNSASISLSNDLLVGIAAFTAWSFVEARRLDLRRWWIFPILTFGIAFACAFPLFLFFRDRRLQALGHA